MFHIFSLSFRSRPQGLPPPPTTHLPTRLWEPGVQGCQWSLEWEEISSQLVSQSKIPEAEPAGPVIPPGLFQPKEQLRWRSGQKGQRTADSWLWAMNQHSSPGMKGYSIEIMRWLEWGHKRVFNFFFLNLSQHLCGNLIIRIQSPTKTRRPQEKVPTADTTLMACLPT